MPSCRTLAGKFTPPHREGHCFPFAWLSIAVGANESAVKAHTLIDTGSGINLVSFAKAMLMLGMPREDIIASKERTISLRGAGGKIQTVYGFRRDLRIRAELSGSDYLAFQNSWIFVAENVIDGYDALLGQLDGLQERYLRHHNHAANRQWQIHIP
jgi:hypothetical protein